MMAVCNMTTENFEGKTAGDAFLDKKWKCRVCKLLAGSHPPPPSAGTIHSRANILYELLKPLSLIIVFV